LDAGYLAKRTRVGTRSVSFSRSLFQSQSPFHSLGRNLARRNAPPRRVRARNASVSNVPVNKAPALKTRAREEPAPKDPVLKDPVLKATVLKTTAPRDSKQFRRSWVNHLRTRTRFSDNMALGEWRVAVGHQQITDLGQSVAKTRRRTLPSLRMG